MTADVDRALRDACATGVDRLDAQVLMAGVLGQTRTWLFAHGDHLLSPEDAARFAAQVARRAGGEPLAYIAGEKEFHGLVLQVSPDVLVPRPDTETLVDWALEVLQLPGMTGTPAVVDLGTGSGAIALALKSRLASADITAIDVSDAALAVATANGRRLGLAVDWRQGPWWGPVAERRFHVAVSNPPYIAGDDPHLDALTHEPRLALTPEGDGLAALRDIVAGAPAHLAPGGWLLLEHGHDQAAAVAALLRDAGFTGIRTRHDLAGRDRCTGGRCA